MSLLDIFTVVAVLALIAGIFLAGIVVIGLIDPLPLDRRTWRPARVWVRTSCGRRVREEGQRCWQHRSDDTEYGA